MPFRPSSAPTPNSSALLRKRRDLGGSRVQFREGLSETDPGPDWPRELCVPTRFIERPPRPLPKDPLPDSDEETEGKDATLSPQSAERLALSLQSLRTSYSNGESKWWHVPDTRIEEIVQTADDSASSVCASSSPQRQIVKSNSCPSSTCRALTNAGQRAKRPVLANGSMQFESGQMDTQLTSFSRSSPVSMNDDSLRSVAAGHVAPDTFAASSTLLRDIQLRDAIAKGLTWPLEDRRPFDHWSSPKRRDWNDADMLLSATKSPLDSTYCDSLDRPSTAPEQIKKGRAARCPIIRPGSSGGEAKVKSRQAQNHVSSSKLSRSSTHSGHRHPGISDNERELIQVELAFYDNSDRICVLVHPEARVGPDLDSCESEKMTLKGVISNLTGVAPSSQRLLCRGFDVSDDLMTLRKAGIFHESIVTVYHRKDYKQSKDDVVLACTAKRLEKQLKKQQQDSRRAACLREARREKKSTMMMPKWGWGVPADNVIVGKNSDFRFENHHIWHDMQSVDFRLTDIRSHQTYTQPIDYTSSGVAPHCQ